MPFLIKNLFRTALAESIVNEIVNKTNRYYYFFSRTSIWPQGDFAPPAPADAYSAELRARDLIIYAKQIQGSDVSLIANRINWQAGAIFDRYDDSYCTEVIGCNVVSGGTGYTSAPTVTITGTGTGATATASFSAITGKVTGITMVTRGTGYVPSSTAPLTVTLSGGGGTGAVVTGVIVYGQANVQKLEDAKYYVYTDDFNVYVCLDNNGGALTSEKPYGTSANPITTADGYIWKYLYTVPISLRERFLTPSYIPVSTSLKQQFYSGGSISNVRIDAPGNGYTGTTKITVSGDGYLASDPYFVTALSIPTAGVGYTAATLTIDPPVGGPLSNNTWTTGRVYVQGQYVSNGNNVYQVTVGGTSSATAPTHVSGSVTLGATFTYVGTAATATAVVSGGAITSVTPVLGVRSVNIASGGTGYANGPNAITFSGGAATGVAFAQGGIIYRIDITNPGFGYTTAPTITSIAGGGTGFAGTCLMKSGAGYTSTPNVAVSGTGTITTTAVVTAQTIKSEALIYPIISGGTLSGIQIADGGIGYSTVTATVTGTAGSGALITPNVLIGDVTTLQSSTELTAVDGGIYVIPVVSGGYGFTSPPQVIISGDGIGATATATIFNGSVNKITVTAPGAGFHFANVQIVGDGVGATARVVIPPTGGHGKNIVKALGARSLMIYSNLSKDKVNGLNLNNDYRQFGILRNPTALGTGVPLNTTVASGCVAMTPATSVPAAFIADASILNIPITNQVQATVSAVSSTTVFTVGSATGLLTGMAIDGTGITPGTTITVNGTTITLSQPASGLAVNNVYRFNWLQTYTAVNVSSTNIVCHAPGDDTPVVGDTFYYGGTSFTAATVTLPAIDKYSGDVLYINNTSPFKPQDGTAEKITVSTVLKF